MNNAQCIRQTGQPYDIRHTFNLNIFCPSDDSRISSGFCLSDKFDEHGTSAHIQKQDPFSITGTSTGTFTMNSILLFDNYQLKFKTVLVNKC